MTAILSTCILFLGIYFIMPKLYLSKALTVKSNEDKNALYFTALIVLAAIVHIICAAVYPGHKTDMNCFSAWADMVFNDGISNFYTSDAFHDYPPGYMYVLYAIGALKKLFGLTTAYTLVKMPAIICSLLTGYFIYKIALKHEFGMKTASVLSALYLFNPSVIVNGSLWGQVDSVYTLTTLLMVYLISEKKMIASYFVFAICIFIKPQSLIFTPVLILGIVENLFLDDFDIRKIIKNLLYGLCAIGMMFLLALPFGISNVIEQYMITVTEQYPYMTVNAFNLWGAFGNNWEALTPAASIAGYVFIALITLYSAYIFLKCKDKSKYYFTAALLSFLTYMLSVKMHDRYAFPAMAFLLMAFIINRNFRTYGLYTLVTLSQYFNTVWVLFIYEQDINLYYKSPVIVAASIINVCLTLFMIASAYSQYAKNRVTVRKIAQVTKTSVVRSEYNYKCDIKPTKKLPGLTKADIIAMAVITIIYSVVALYDLGDMKAPETEAEIINEPLRIELRDEADIKEMKFFNGSYNIDASRKLIVNFENENNEVTKTLSIDSASVFAWSEKEVGAKAKYVSLYAESGKISLKELALSDNNGAYIEPIQNDKIQALFDEQTLIPENATFRNGTYFDEIYHARTAYEFIHGLEIYEWTHPPLGKLIIALGIKIFGMCPFGWRIAGTLFGILMVPWIYIFAKRFLKYSWLSVVCCVLFTFDFMHFAQTRIATIDVYVTFFIILMYYYMFKYQCMSFYDTPLAKTFIPLALSGAFMGLGIASKWTGVYAGAGLAIIFFATIIKRYNEYRHALKNPSGETNGISHEHIVNSFKTYTIKTIIACCIFFGIIPLTIYVLSYIPYMKTPSGNGLMTVVDNARAMFTYHADTVLGSEHPFSSRWFEWPIMVRPIFFYSGTITTELREGISSFGNPALWWIAIAAFFLMVYEAVMRRNGKAAFLAVGYLAQFVPWIPISRLTFIYHYFPCVPFLALMVGYSIYVIYEEAGSGIKSSAVVLKKKKQVMYGAVIYAAVAVLLFILFYPVLSGQPCTVSFAQRWLKWFDSWVLLQTWQ